MHAKHSNPKPQPMQGEMTMRQAVAARMQEKLREPANWMMGHASFEIDGKVYCFVTRDGSLAMKLPQSKIGAALESVDARLLTMGSRTMREWVVVPESGSRATLKLLDEAKKYVASLPAKARRKPAAKTVVKKSAGKKSTVKKSRGEHSL